MTTGLKSTIENHPVVIFGTALVVGFAAGFTASQTLLQLYGNQAFQQRSEASLRNETAELREQVTQLRAQNALLASLVPSDAKTKAAIPSLPRASKNTGRKSIFESESIGGTELARFSDGTTVSVQLESNLFSPSVLVNGELRIKSATVGARTPTPSEDGLQCYIEFAGTSGNNFFGKLFQHKFNRVCTAPGN